ARHAGSHGARRRNGRRPAAALEPAAARARRAGDSRQHRPRRLPPRRGRRISRCACLTSTSRWRHSSMLARFTCRSICRLRETVSPGRRRLCVIVRSLRRTQARSPTGGWAFFAFSFVTCNFDALCYHPLSTHKILLLREALRALPTNPGVSATCAPRLPGALLLFGELCGAVHRPALPSPGRRTFLRLWVTRAMGEIGRASDRRQRAQKQPPGAHGLYR